MRLRKRDRAAKAFKKIRDKGRVVFEEEKEERVYFFAILIISIFYLIGSAAIR